MLQEKDSRGGAGRSVYDNIVFEHSTGGIQVSQPGGGGDRDQ